MAAPTSKASRAPWTLKRGASLPRDGGAKGSRLSRGKEAVREQVYQRESLSDADEAATGNQGTRRFSLRDDEGVHPKKGRRCYLSKSTNMDRKSWETR